MGVPQYTTPTFTLNFTEQSLDLTQARNVYVTFKSEGTLITKTGEDLTVLFDPETNVMCGTYYLRWLSNRLSGTKEIVVAYNYGIGNVLRMLADENYSTDGKTLIYDNIPSASARSYLKRVMASYESYKLKYGE